MFCCMFHFVNNYLNIICVDTFVGGGVHLNTFYNSKVLVSDISLHWGVIKEKQILLTNLKFQIGLVWYSIKFDYFYNTICMLENSDRNFFIRDKTCV